MMYRNCDSEEHYYSLHDCRAEKIVLEDGILSFFFPNGFWVIDEHPLNELNSVVRTDASKVDFHVPHGEIDDMNIYIFSKTMRGKIIREELGLKDFIDAVNKGTYCIEFIEQYKGYRSSLHKCWAWFEQRPYHKECEIIIPADKITYCWNLLCEDKTW